MALENAVAEADIDALELTENEQRAKISFMTLLKHCRQWLLISSGTLSHRIYAGPDIVNVLEKACEDSISLNILVGPRPDPATLRKFKFLWNSIFVLAEEPLLHFAVADGLHVRYEGAHSTSQPTPRNCIALYAPRSAQKLMVEASGYIGYGVATVAQMVEEGRLKV